MRTARGVSLGVSGAALLVLFAVVGLQPRGGSLLPDALLLQARSAGGEAKQDAAAAQVH
jgi:hypothetical protein